MLRVVDTLKVGNMTSVVLSGNIHSIKNGAELKDNQGNIFKIDSVGMVEHIDKKYQNDTIFVLISSDIAIGTELELIEK